jgi:S-adenosyl-L-methionine methyltransferase
MSKLDSFIRRMSAQRDCLDLACDQVKGRQGPVLELGLGNGRTYDHVRELFGEERVFVFDRQVASRPDCTPPADNMIVGDFTETLPSAVSKIGSKALMAHCDIGTGDKAASVALATTIGEMLDKLLADEAMIVSDQPFDRANWQLQSLPEGVAPGRYHIYRKTG